MGLLEQESQKKISEAKKKNDEIVTKLQKELQEKEMEIERRNEGM